MLPERGGSATFARHALQRAGQLHRRLGDPDRLRDRHRARGDLGAALPDADLVGVHRHGAARSSPAALVIALTAALTIGGFTGAGRAAAARRDRDRRRGAAARGDRRRAADLVRPRRADRRARPVRLDRQPRATSIYAGVIATVAFAGIEAAANLAPEIRTERRATCASWWSSRATLVPLIYVGVAAVALMAVPVVATPDGPQTALGGDLPRGAGARRGAELRPGLGLGPDAGRGGRDRAGGADLGGEHGDARALAPRLRARDQPPDPELARQAQPALRRRRTWRS